MNLILKAETINKITFRKKWILDDIEELLLILLGLVIVLQLQFSKNPYLLEIYSEVLVNEIMSSICLKFLSQEK